MLKRAIGYRRVSSVGGRSGPEYHTLEIQQASIERVAAFHRYELIDTLTDEDRSGGNRNRPEFQQAMSRVLAGEADALIVWKVSRFSRNWREAAEDVQRLLDNGKDLLSEEGFDTKTTGGRLLLRILFSMANWEHEVLGEHWETIKTKAVRDRGSHLGQAPLGYRHSGVGGVLEPDPGTAGLVVRLFEQRAAGASWADLTRVLDREHPRVSGTGRELKVAQRIIANRVYVGEVRWRDQIRAGAHPPLVPVDVWERANRVTVPADYQPRRTPRGHQDYPLTGWLRCSSCGHTMSGHGGPKRPGGQRYRSYACNRRNGGCAKPQIISANAAETWALGQVERLYEHERARGHLNAAAGELGDAVAELAEVEAALHALASVQVRRDLGDDWLVMMRQLRAEKVAKEQTVARLRERAGLPTGSLSWADLSEDDRWRVLRSMVPAGAAVYGAVGRGRHARPADRLGFVTDELEDGSVPG